MPVLSESGAASAVKWRMNRLALSSLLALLLAAPASAAPAAKVWFYLSDYGTAGGPAQLAIQVQTSEEFSCANYTLPVSARVEGSVITVRVGAVVPPPHNICATAFGPARGSASIGALAAGSYRLQLARGRVVDSYPLIIGSDSTKVDAPPGRFSSTQAMTVYRVAEGAAHLFCSFTPDGNCIALSKKGAPTCETLFADPAVTALAPLDAPGPFSQSWFNEQGKRFAAPAFEKLRPIVRSDRYRDTARCLYISAHSGRGESFDNRNF